MVVNQCILANGDTINSTYRIIKVLGEGSFGKVFLVVDGYNREFALKLLRLWEVHPDIRTALTERFDMEFETGKIESNYLVRSIDHGIISGNPYLVMEYCRNGDLLQLCSKKSLDLTKVACNVLYGLGDLHNHGKVHRDLKPENVLLKDDGTFALTDFGISGDRNKRMTERNIMGKPKQMFGTYAYMPPEQLNPRKDATVLPTTDIFSFGVMMFQLITKQLPFGRLDNDGDLPSYIRNGREGRWNRNAILQISGGDRWLSLLEGCLEPDYSKRLQNVNNVLKTIPFSDNDKQKCINSFNNKVQSFNKRVIHGVLLRIMQGEEYGKIFKLDDMLISDHALITMGRKDVSIRNTIDVQENQSCYISRKHCTFELDYNSGQWVVRDGQWAPEIGWKRSTNGTYVNSKEAGIDGLPFNPGDIISIGDVKLRVEAY